MLLREGTRAAWQIQAIAITSHHNSPPTSATFFLRASQATTAICRHRIHRHKDQSLRSISLTPFSRGTRDFSHIRQKAT